MGIKSLQLVLIVLVLGVGIYLLRLSHATRLEKRIGNFSIVSVKEKELTLMDTILNIIWKIVSKIKVLVSKSVVLTSYGKKYDKFITYEEKSVKEGIDYVALKILISLTVLVLGLITFIIHGKGFDMGIFLLVLIISFFIPDIFLNLEFRKKRKRVEEDLLKAIIIMNNAFGSGRNIMQAVECVKNELDGPIQDEFKKIYLDITYGLGLDVVFHRFYERVKLEDAKYITTSLSLLNKTGGNIVKVFSRLEKSLYDKKSLKHELYSLTASSRFVFKFLIALPIFFAFIIFILNPSYFLPLVSSALGILVLSFILLLYVLYIIVVRKVLQVEL